MWSRARRAELYAGPAVAQIPMASLGRLFPSRLGVVSALARTAILRCDEELSAQLARTTERRAQGHRLVLVEPQPPLRERPKARSCTISRAFCGCRIAASSICNMATRRPSAKPCSTISACTVERLPDVDNTNDIDALASLITACDIVVTVSNTTAHLAGALGKETYVLVPSGRGRMWCWFRDRDDSPFYPRVRLKRQKPKQPWSELVAEIAAEIAAQMTTIKTQSQMQAKAELDAALHLRAGDGRASPEQIRGSRTRLSRRSRRRSPIASRRCTFWASPICSRTSWRRRSISCRAR